MKIKDTHFPTIITSTIFIFYRSLNEQEAQLMNELDDFYDIVTLSRDRQKLERTIFRLERAHDFAEQLLSSNTSPIAQIVNRWAVKLDSNSTNNLSFRHFQTIPLNLYERSQSAYYITGLKRKTAYIRHWIMNFQIQWYMRGSCCRTQCSSLDIMTLKLELYWNVLMVAALWFLLCDHCCHLQRRCTCTPWK